MSCSLEAAKQQDELWTLPGRILIHPSGLTIYRVVKAASSLVLFPRGFLRIRAFPAVVEIFPNMFWPSLPLEENPCMVSVLVITFVAILESKIIK